MAMTSVRGSRKVELLVAEIGSTTTLVNAFDWLESGRPCLVGQGLCRTTVDEGDVLHGLEGAVAELRRRLGVAELTWDELMACSSAAGGLRMTVHGLVYDMTAKAANEAALGAGAVVRFVTAGDLSESDLRRITEERPNIILLAGGVDYGERQTAVDNARKLASIGPPAPVIYAGNVACRDQVVELLGPETRVVENVYPRIDQLNIEPTRRAIQELFEKHIVRAPGMSRVRQMVSGTILPTPGAVMEAAELMQKTLGNLVVLDVGGATTDVHSVTRESDEVARMLVAPEPFAKRTVEGDLGVFKNARNLVRRIGEDKLSQELELDVDEVLDTLQPLPETDEQYRLVVRLTEEAVRTAVARHAGKLRHLYGPSGRSTIAEGKDLTQVEWIIGTGGPLTALPEGPAILEQLTRNTPPMALYPRHARVLIDTKYIMAVAGVLSHRNPQAARLVLAESLGVLEQLQTPAGDN